MKITGGFGIDIDVGGTGVERGSGGEKSIDGWRWVDLLGGI